MHLVSMDSNNMIRKNFYLFFWMVYMKMSTGLFEKKKINYSI